MPAPRPAARARRGYGYPPPDPARHRDARIELPAAGPCRIVVIADTHSVPHPEATPLIEREEPVAILHAGDIGDLALLDHFAKLAPLVAIRGNIDIHTGPPDTVRIELARAGAVCLVMMLIHIAVNGHRLRSDARALARGHHAQLVVCGHSHVPLIAASDGLAVFNPGSIGPRRFQLPITFGVIEIAASGLSFRHVDCETGATWAPGGRA